MFVRTLQVRALMYVVTLTREVMKVRSFPAYLPGRLTAGQSEAANSQLCGWARILADNSQPLLNTQAAEKQGNPRQRPGALLPCVCS